MTAKFRSKSIASGISAAIAVCAIVAPCAAQSASGTSAVAAKSNAPAAASNVAPNVAVPTEYIIGADDVMKVDFWRDKELSSEVTVRPDGKISLIVAKSALSQVNARPYSEADWHWRLLVAHSFGHAAAAETVKGVLAKLDAEGVAGEMQLREVREGRAEIVEMWGRPESVREEFRQRRSL